MRFPNVGAVYDRARYHNSRMCAVIDRAYSWNSEPSAA